MKTFVKAAATAAVTFFIAASANAGTMMLTDKQMDQVAAGGVEKVDGFVCPVITTAAVLNSPNAVQINGAYTIIGPNVSVPIHATNDDGAGRPGGDFASPGDANYSAVWGFRPN